MNVKWPDPMPEGGRLSNKEVHAAWSTGYCSVADPKFSCQQTLHLSLFFDGTNNNDDTDQQIWINVIGFSRGAAAARAFVHSSSTNGRPGLDAVDCQT
jgi:hypothetical protein